MEVTTGTDSGDELDAVSLVWAKTVHINLHKESLEVILDAQPKQWVHLERESWMLLQGIFIAYVFVSSLHPS